MFNRLSTIYLYLFLGVCFSQSRCSAPQENNNAPVEAVTDEMIQKAQEGNFSQLTTILKKLQQGEKVDDIINQFDHNDPLQKTALHEAAKLGDTTISKLLIKQGADIEAKTKNNTTPLYLAAFHNKLEMAKLLIEAKANMEAAGKEGYTPLAAAAYYGHADIVQLLLENGANRKSKTDLGYTSLILAKKQLKANPNKKSQYERIVKLLEEQNNLNKIE